MLDVCLIVEGTYPYVPGGVSAWVNQMIEGLSSLRFAVVYIGAESDTAREPHYRLHDNVERFVETFLHDDRLPVEWSWTSPPAWLAELGVGRARRREAFSRLRSFLERVSGGVERVRPADVDGVAEILAGRGRNGLSISTALGSHETWDLIRWAYERFGRGCSFLDFFWTTRMTHLPLLRLLRTEVPEAAVYHTVSTGYAGLLAAVAARRYGSPLLVTEHGIYTKERRLEIQRADWIEREGPDRARAERSLGVFKDWWAGLFTLMARLAYQQATEIITLFEGNRRLEIADGAPPTRCSLLPNGVDLSRFEALRALGRPLPEKEAPFIALVGRVVPVKDVKSFIRTARLVLERIGPAVIQVIGPTDEDEAYYRDCLLQLRMLGLEGRVELTGPRDMREVLTELDCLVLTSISEGQPLVILEAMAAGVPVVATDVGACRDLLEGSDPPDRKLGSAGVVCPVASPEAVARGIERCIRDLEFRAQASRSGMDRVRQRYRRESMLAAYQDIYEHYGSRRRSGERFTDPGEPRPEIAAAKPRIDPVVWS